MTQIEYANKTNGKYPLKVNVIENLKQKQSNDCYHCPLLKPKKYILHVISVQISFKTIFGKVWMNNSRQVNGVNVVCVLYTTGGNVLRKFIYVG